MSKNLFAITILLVLTVTFPTLAGSAMGVTRYVDPNGSADFTSIQAAINTANDNDEIEVAPGTYNEAINFNGKAIRLYSSGGPDVTTIDANGIIGVYHVVQCVSGEDANTILEGFTITGGNARSAFPNDSGGGMYCVNSSPTVTNCTFGNNSAYYGGGMYNYASNPTVTNCTFGNNSAYYGGGMCTWDNSSPTVTDCTFSGNTADYNGGGLYNNTNGHLRVVNCTFVANWTFYSGGAVWNLSDNPTFINCVFGYNYAFSGLGNDAVTSKGGGIYNKVGNPTLINCYFAYNGVGDDYGGAMYNEEGNPTVTNCTFRYNMADYGDGIYNETGAPTLTNCILWDDQPIVGGTPLVSYSDINGGWSGAGGDNINADPCFVDDESYFLRPISPCIDAGSNDAPSLPPTDLLGNPRIVDGDRNGTSTVDMGAFELQLRIHNTTQDTWYAGIQMAIDVANDYDEIEVTPGIYYEAIDFKGKAVRLYSSDGPNVTTIDANGLSSSVASCTSGEGLNTVLEGFTITGGMGTTVGAYKYGGGVYNLNSSPTVRNCKFTTNYVTGDGGGMYNNNSSPTVTNCSFIANNAVWAGGGMDNRNSSNPTVTNCTFSQNTAGTNGGGLENWIGSDPTVTNCMFKSNHADYGGGMYNNYSNPELTDCTFTSNTARSNGGGMSNELSSSPTVTGCTFSRNTASSGDVGGGGMFNFDSSSPIVTDCNFTNNLAYNYGGGMMNLTSSSPTVTNCEFTNNTANNNGGGMMNHTSSSPTVTGCTFSRNTASSGDVGGGGMFNFDSSSPIVTDCNFTNNLAYNYGGGMMNLTSSSPTVTNCEFTNNTANNNGGGMMNHTSSSPTVTNCKFTGNKATNNSGGGMMNHTDSSPTVTNCIFTGNQTEWGGGMFNHIRSDPDVINCTFSQNTADTSGGGMYNYQSSPTVTNCTFRYNMADYGDGIYNETGAPSLTNCILWDDQPIGGGGTPSVSYSDINGGWSGAGGNNIDADPCFVDAAGGNLRLLYDSPCIDIGDNNTPNLPVTDLAGNKRIFDGDEDGSAIVDMGAYEFGSTKLLGHWKLDESSGGTAYDSIGDNHGMLTTYPVWIGGALEFDGLNDFVSIPNESNFDITDEITVAAYIKVNAFDRPWQAIVTKGNYAWRIQRDAQNNALEFAVSGTSAGNVLGSVNVNDGQWHHVAGVYDGTMIYLYVDGAVDNSVPASGTISTNDFPVMIGENAEELGRCWNGLMDDVVILSRALDGTDITDLKNRRLALSITDPNLRARWELDESIGATAPDITGANHGTLEPALTPPLWQPAGGRLGGALEFDGIEDFVSIPNESNFDITNEITVSAWIKVNAFDKEWQAIVTKGDSAWRLHRLQDTNSIAFHYQNYSPWGVDGTIDVNDGQWHHVAGVYDGTQAYLYVDGILDNNEPSTELIPTNDSPVMIGENAESPGRYWNGLIDDVAIFSRALDGTDITDLKNNGGALFIGDPNLSALWELDESIGATAHDSSGNGIDGSLEPSLWQPTGGRLDGALEFDGSNVSIPNESRFDITYQLTVSAWIQVDAFDKDWQAIVTKGDSAWRLHRLQDTNSIAFHCNMYPDYWGADGSIEVNDGQWHHVAGVYDGTRAYLYVDGVLDNSVPAFGLIWTNNYPVMIGKNAESPGRYWNGLIDDVRIYTSALTADEILQISCAGTFKGDLDYNCRVDFFDYSIFSRSWMTKEGDADYDPACNISDPPGDYIDWRDVAVLCENWLSQIP